MTWSRNMGFEDPRLADAQRRMDRAEAKYNHVLALSRCKTKKTREKAKKELIAKAHAALRAGLELERCK
jgi:hypothetical protein